MWVSQPVALCVKVTKFAFDILKMSNKIKKRIDTFMPKFYRKKQQHIICLETKRYDNAYSKEYLLKNGREVSIRVTRLK